MLACDLETTGLLKPDLVDARLQPCITEIYVCKFDWDGNITAEFETFVKPTLPIPDNVIEITGITNEMVADAPSFIEIYDDLVDFFLGEKMFFAHNCSYEIGVLSCELRKFDLDYRFPWPAHQICTVEAAMPISNKRLKLGQLYKEITGKEMPYGHRAKVDVLAMVECIVGMKKRGLL